MLDIRFDAFPVLETARLHLREIVDADAEDLFRLRNLPETTRYLDRDNDPDVASVLDLIARLRAALAQGEGVTWALSLRDDPKLIGTLAFWRLDKQHHRGEIGYLLAPEHWGKGLMREAMAAVLAYGFEQLRLHGIEANTAVGNRASHALLEHFGFVREAHFRENWYHNGKFTDSIIYCKLTDIPGN